MSIPLPNVNSEKKEFKSECDLYDGTPETGGLCKGWITKSGKCLRRDDEIGKNCDGFGNISKS